MGGKAQRSADRRPRGERVRPEPEREAALEDAARARPDRVEPAGDQDPAAEREMEQATARAEQPEDADSPSSAASPPAGSPQPSVEADATVPDEGAVEESPPSGREPEPEDPLSRAERERSEYLTLAQRTQADFENYRKRAAKEAAAAGARAKGGLVRELLPVLDNLERALASAERSEQHLAEGVRLVHAELVAVLARHGVEPFDPTGESFDPAVHEALSLRSEEGADAGVVLDVVEKGYKLDGAVLRPARVVVSG